MGYLKNILLGDFNGMDSWKSSRQRLIVVVVAETLVPILISFPFL